MRSPHVVNAPIHSRDAFYSTLWEWQRKGQFCDVVLQCDDGLPIPCHRVILALASDFFRTMLLSRMVESKAGAVIKLPDEQGAVVELALAYMYTGQVEVDSGAAALMLAQLADKWVLPHLTASCLALLDKHYARKGKEAVAAWDILRIVEPLAGHVPEAARLVKTCVGAILRSPCPALSASQCLEGFGREAVRTVLARSTLPADVFPNEDAVARFACAWLASKVHAPEAHAILGQVRWGHCSTSAVNELTTEIPGLARLIHVADRSGKSRWFASARSSETVAKAMAHGVGVDGEGRILVADAHANQIKVFEADGTPVATWGSLGGGEGKFNQPCGVAVDGEGRIVVADWGNNRIQVFAADGTFLFKWGGLGGSNGKFKGPSGVAVDDEGRIFVADEGNNRIQVFAADGTFLAKWGCKGDGDSQFNSPRGVAVDGEGRVIVVDTFNSRIQVFAADGTFMAKWGSEGTGDGELNAPLGVAVDDEGRIIVADTANHRIQAFKADGKFLAKWGRKGWLYGQVNSPKGVAVDGEGRIIVADTHNHRIQAVWSIV
jgi:DNA-binding beta-propeller fold protein YncE